MKLYSTTGAPNPRRVRIFLAEKEIEVPIQEISIMEQEHKEENYKKISPSSRVPALVLDDGTVILESMAICRYFELLNPEPILFGNTELEQAVIEMQSRRMEMELMMSVAGTFRHTHPAFAKLENQIPEYGKIMKKEEVAVANYRTRISQVLEKKGNKWIFVASHASPLFGGSGYKVD